MGRWTWACTSQVGTSHTRTGQRLQDAYSCFSIETEAASVFVGIVSDGAGSAEFGGEGASLVCRSVGVAARRHFAASPGLPSPAEVEMWVDGARDAIYRAAAQRAKTARDFACTLVCAISNGETSVVIHVGDGCVVAREAATCTWFAPTWPDHGEYASTTTFVTDQPTAKVRVSIEERQVDVLALFSDGIERMVLDMAAQQPSEKFFAVMARPVLTSRVDAGKDRPLSRQLQDYLDSEQVNARTDDDKTLVIAALR
ncbi:PP2C family serine/threonine-protein phosphatase [Roseateles noduli]|uniref:PP2C family serine/threonine-protein phosphatase n=1 Tax=Roseateles noduli TaxID=2052484 RepID=UPI003D662538